MTAEEKQTESLHVKAAAFDDLKELVDLAEYNEIANRRFVERVLNVFRQADLVLKGIAAAKDTSQQFPCAICREPATCQVYRHGDEGSLPYCEECAKDALMHGEYTIVEESL